RPVLLPPADRPSAHPTLDGCRHRRPDPGPALRLEAAPGPSWFNAGTGRRQAGRVQPRHLLGQRSRSLDGPSSALVIVGELRLLAWVPGPERRGRRARRGVATTARLPPSSPRAGGL